MKNTYLKQFLFRGLIFSGLGPIVVGIVYLCLQLSGTQIEVNGIDVFKAIMTGYVMAFVHAGTSVFPTIEHWSKPKAMGLMFLCLYSVYTIGYLANGWLPFDWKVVAIYTTCFVVGYLVIWLIAFITAKISTQKLNEKLAERLNQKLE